MFKVYFSCIFQLFLLKLYYGKAIYICLDVIVVSCIYCHNWNLSKEENLFSSNYDKQRLERKITFSYNNSLWKSDEGEYGFVNTARLLQTPLGQRNFFQFMIRDTPTLALSMMISVGTFAQVKVLKMKVTKFIYLHLSFAMWNLVKGNKSHGEIFFRESSFSVSFLFVWELRLIFEGDFLLHRCHTRKSGLKSKYCTGELI